MTLEVSFTTDLRLAIVLHCTWFRQKGEQAKNDRQNQNDYFN